MTYQPVDGQSSSWIRSPFLPLSPKTPYFHSTPRRSFILRAVAGIALLTLPLFFYTYLYDSARVHDIIDDIIAPSPSPSPSPSIDDRTAWIQESLESEIDGPFDGKAIKALCEQKSWEHRVAISCGTIQGGVGNVRNVVLTCLRFVIEAGGDLVMPTMKARSKDDLAVLNTGEDLGFDYMFDEGHFRKSLSKFCPGMKVYENVDAVQTKQDTASLNPQDLIPDRPERVLSDEEASEWSSYFEDWLLDLEAANADKVSSGPIPVKFGGPLFHWPINYDDADFMNSFGRLLLFREDTRRLGATVLYELSRKFELDLGPSEFMTPGMFFGAHLRTAEDAAKANWPGYDIQAERYLEQARHENISVIYVATGSAKDMDRFAKQAWSEYQYNTTSKLDLLEGDELAYLQSLTWDQQALVDFVVMLKSSSFAGITHSSFAWNIALKRHVLSSNTDYLMHKEALQDEYSTILGGKGSFPFFAKAMWP